MVQELLTTYDGGIAVRSQLDHGTTFSFWLPLHEAPDAPTLSEETPDPTEESNLP
jgi:signal transduction histidine kinase